MEDHDQELEERLSNIYDVFQSKVDTLLRYTNEVLRICSVSLAASNIRHVPITKRIKSWESAKGSIRRQHHEMILRRRLRVAVERTGRVWEEYCREMGLQSHENETEAFQTPAEMFASLQDFGGMRISLYFPGDVERVAGILQDHLQVVKVTNKHQGSGGRMRRMQELIGYLQTPELGEVAHRPTDGSSPVQRGFARIFSGYKATHFIVKLREEDIPDDRKYAWKDVVVEIQVGTLVMHVWSEIEHDMIYKPLDSQGEGVSDDEERLLDLINGIVLTGEAALQQLEASTTKRLNGRASNKDAMASSYFELATWIEKDCQALGMPLTGGEWWLLDRLYAILKAMGNHKHSEVANLLKAVATSHSLSRQTLPISMLEALCQRSRLAYPEWPIFDGFTIMALAQNARLWAIRLVHSLNLAIYLGVGEAFINIDVPQPRPSLVSFLDILHPDCPSYANAESAEVISEFCRAIVNPSHRPNPTLNRIVDALDVTKKLPRTNTVVSIAGSTSSHTILVPDMISRLLPIDDIVGNFPGRYVGESELYRLLDFIEFYVSHDGDKVDNHIDIWDRLTGQAINRQYKTPVDRHFFVPRPSRQEKDAGLWQLVDCPMHLEIVKLHLDEMSQANKEVRRNDFNNIVGPSDGFLELAYRIFPANQHEGVRKASSMARALRPGRNLAYSHSDFSNLRLSTGLPDEDSPLYYSEPLGFNFNYDPAFPEPSGFNFNYDSAFPEPSGFNFNYDSVFPPEPSGLNFYNGSAFPLQPPVPSTWPWHLPGVIMSSSAYIPYPDQNYYHSLPNLGQVHSELGKEEQKQQTVGRSRHISHGKKRKKLA